MKNLFLTFICLGTLFLSAVLLHAENIPLIEQFALTSPAFIDEGDIPQLYTCKGADTNPPLKIHNVPARTRSLVLIVREPENPIGPWTHWLVYNIRPGIQEIKENSVPGTQALNDFGNFYYGGPCVFDAGQHKFLFTVYALDSYLDNVNEGSTFETIEKAMKGKVIGKAQLVGVYQNPLWARTKSLSEAFLVLERDLEKVFVMEQRGFITMKFDGLKDATRDLEGYASAVATFNDAFDDHAAFERYYSLPEHKTRDNALILDDKHERMHKEFEILKPLILAAHNDVRRKLEK